VYVPRWIVLGLMVAVASVAGWLLRDLTTDCVAAIRSATTHESGRPLDLTVDVADPHTGTPSSDPASTLVAMPIRPSRTTLVVSASGGSGTRLVPSPVAIAQPVIFRETLTRELAPTTYSPVTATGDHIVIASDGSIVSVGDNTVVKGNTGNAGSSGAISVDVNGSTIDTGESTGAEQGSTSSTADPSTPRSGATPAGPMTDRASATATPSASRAPCTSVANGTTPGTRAVGIAGWDNRALDVAGSDNVLTYDDSAVFMHRVGAINANTGDVDSSGVNTVDAIDSRVRTGSSTSSGIATTSSPFDPARVPAGCQPGVFGTPGSDGVSVIDSNGITTAQADDTLVIGGDGIHDRSVRMRGDGNVATYDDGTATIGGIGNVNAQIGDSTTSGAVVMGVRSSDIASGDSSQRTSARTQPATGGSR
jgi:hypothetical protein